MRMRTIHRQKYFIEALLSGGFSDFPANFCIRWLIYLSRVFISGISTVQLLSQDSGKDEISQKSKTQFAKMAV